MELVSGLNSNIRAVRQLAKTWLNPKPGICHHCRRATMLLQKTKFEHGGIVCIGWFWYEITLGKRTH